jgi:peptidoglycan/xylan/chitin deacetylase (PgdA/CDA1 family)
LGQSANRASLNAGTFVGALRRRLSFGGSHLLRELPRGPFGLYLHAHYRRVPGVMARFAMGCGAIFMVQRVRPQTDSLIGQGAIAETDPMLLDEMVALVIEQGLDVVSLAEVRRRLAARETGRRFVCFTFDGAYKSTLASIGPLFRARGLPFAVFVGADFLDSGRLPWWMALEALVGQRETIRLYRDRKAQDFACGAAAEKRDCFARLFREIGQLPSPQRAGHAEKLCREHNVDLAAIAAREMASSAELKDLAEDALATIGSQAGGMRPLSELAFDEARDDLAGSLDKLEAVLGVRPRHIAYPGVQPSCAGAREFMLAQYLGLETAVTAVEGALWPEHAGELFALPRIALDNDPATLVRALMLSGGAAFGAGMTAVARASA